MRAIIPVAGYGTRMRPHTYSLPKVLLNVAGKPILGHILDSLQAQNINEATIIVGYMKELVQEYVTKNYNMDVTFVHQEQPMGLGHSIWCARDTYGNEPVFIILGDTIFDVDLSLALGSSFNTLGVKEVVDLADHGRVLAGVADVGPIGANDEVILEAGGKGPRRSHWCRPHLPPFPLAYRTRTSIGRCSQRRHICSSSASQIGES